MVLHRSEAPFDAQSIQAGDLRFANVRQVLVQSLIGKAAGHVQVHTANHLHAPLQAHLLRQTGFQVPLVIPQLLEQLEVLANVHQGHDPHRGGLINEDLVNQATQVVLLYLEFRIFEQAAEVLLQILNSLHRLLLPELRGGNGRRSLPQHEMVRHRVARGVQRLQLALSREKAKGDGTQIRRNKLHFQGGSLQPKQGCQQHSLLWQPPVDPALERLHRRLVGELRNICLLHRPPTDLSHDGLRRQGLFGVGGPLAPCFIGLPGLLLLFLILPGVILARSPFCLGVPIPVVLLLRRPLRLLPARLLFGRSSSLSLDLV
mmetsp:Transcript_110148/g.262522  ORF Transcript_110148/g.262522 Transcript_110148/m.262522 type:complete len:317 (-) Transcript_110148:732-1682(-)